MTSERNRFGIPPPNRQARQHLVVNPPASNGSVIRPSNEGQGSEPAATTRASNNGWQFNTPLLAATGKSDGDSVLRSTDPLTFAPEQQGDEPWHIKPSTLQTLNLNSEQEFGRVYLQTDAGTLPINAQVADLGKPVNAPIELSGKPGIRLFDTSDANRGFNTINEDNNRKFAAMLGLPQTNRWGNPTRAYVGGSYWHPETNGDAGEGFWPTGMDKKSRTGSVRDIFSVGGGVQIQYTHATLIGPYGTYNSPEMYHGQVFRTWRDGRPDDAYPVNAYGYLMIDPATGKPSPELQAQFNENTERAALIINPGVIFSSRPYENDFALADDVPTAIMVARDWLKLRFAKHFPNGVDGVMPFSEEEYSYLKRPEWLRYCAEEQSLILNSFASNVQLTQKGFQQMFGVDGDRLWAQYCQVIAKEAAARNLPIGAKEPMPQYIQKPDGTFDENRKKLEPEPVEGSSDFVPIWARMGKSIEEVRPFTGPVEFSEYRKARKQLREGSDPNALNAWMQKFNRTLPPLKEGEAMINAPQSNAQLIKQALEVFTPFDRVGGFVTAGAAFGLLATGEERMGLMPAEEDATNIVDLVNRPAFQVMKPVLAKLMVAEALKTRDPEKFMNEMAPIGLAMAMGIPHAAPQRTLPLDPRGNYGKKELEAASQEILAEAAKGIAAWKEDLGKRGGLWTPKSAGEASTWFKLNAEADLKRADELAVRDASMYVETNFPPHTGPLETMGVLKPNTGGHMVVIPLGTMLDEKFLEHR